MSNWYILEGRVPKKVGILQAANAMLDHNMKTIGYTKIEGISVSTVFLGFDHGWEKGVPILFETMIFGLGEDNEIQERYTTYEQAEEGHKKHVRWAILNCSDFSIFEDI